MTCNHDFDLLLAIPILAPFILTYCCVCCFGVLYSVKQNLVADPEMDEFQTRDAECQTWWSDNIRIVIHPNDDINMCA